MRLLAVLLACAACSDSSRGSLADFPDLEMRTSIYGYVLYPDLTTYYNVVVQFRALDDACPGLVTSPTLTLNGSALEARETILGGMDEFRICREPELRADIPLSALGGTSLDVVVDDGSVPVHASIDNYLLSGTLVVVEPADAMLSPTEKVRAMWSTPNLDGVRHDTAAVELVELDGSGRLRVGSRDLLFEGSELRFSNPALWSGETALTLFLDWNAVAADTCVGTGTCTFTQRVPGTALVQVN